MPATRQYKLEFDQEWLHMSHDIWRKAQMEGGHSSTNSKITNMKSIFRFPEIRSKQMQEEISDLIAEMIVLDYQKDRDTMVGSPGGNNHRKIRINDKKHLQ